jgi:biopolymer transport protein ExbB/TolQ
MTAMQKAGLAVLVLSPVVGLAGTAWSIYSSFGALEAAENAGIGAVGDQIGNAVLFTVGGLVGTAIGLLLIILGRSKADRV